MAKRRAVSWCLPKEEFESDRKSLKEHKLNDFGFQSEHFYDAQQLIRSMAFHPDGSTLCIGSGKGQIEVFDDLEVRKEETLFPKFVGPKQHQRSVLDVAYSPDGALLASCSNDKTIALIDVRSLSCRYRASYYHNIEIEPEHILDHEHSVRCIHFPTCLQLLAGETNECELKLWDLVKHKVMANWSEHVGAITGIQTYDSLMVTGGIDKVMFILSFYRQINDFMKYSDNDCTENSDLGRKKNRANQDHQPISVKNQRYKAHQTAVRSLYNRRS